MARRTAILYVYANLVTATLSIELGRLRRAAAARGWTIERVIVDETNVSYPLSRAAVKSVFKAMKAREAHAVLIPSISHFGGGPNSVLGTIAGVLESGGHVVSLTLTDQLDTSRDDSPEFLRFWDWHCRVEESLVGARRRKGIRRSAIAGRRGGPGGSTAKFSDTDAIGTAVFVEGVPKRVLARKLKQTEWYVRQRCNDWQAQQGQRQRAQAG